jgi:hypothetical protein
VWLKIKKIYFEDTDIFVVENFLTKETLTYFDEKIKNAKWDLEQQWYPWSFNVEKIDQDVTDRIINRIQSLFENQYSWMGSHIIQRIKDGSGMDLHLDKSDVEEQNNSVGIAIYINDNFDGGEIHYPNLGISYKPVRGSLICHPGSAEYTHGVNKTIGNDRYILSSYGLKAVD